MPGTGVGTGTGTGIGEGQGSGIGDGEGGGTGGGPYRPGSGIEPPRLLREVKPDYTDEARRAGLSGEVLLEIVVRRDGSVGDVRVLQGAGAGARPAGHRRGEAVALLSRPQEAGARGRAGRGRGRVQVAVTAGVKLRWCC